MQPDPVTLSTLSNEDIQRYSRQLIMPQIAVEGQKKLLAASVLLIGAGGLCASAGPYLAGAGIGVIDFDDIEVSNLHRQIIHKTSSTGKNKAESAKEYLLGLNPSIQVIAYTTKLNKENALELIGAYDIVVDCSDNPSTRYLINDACVLQKKPLVSGCAVGMEGQASVYNFLDGPCYRCMYPKPPQRLVNCSNSGVLGMVPGLIGIIQAIQVVKLIIGDSSVLYKKLLVFDAASFDFRTIQLPSKDPSCQVCGETPSITALLDYEEFCAVKKAPNVLEEEYRIKPSQYKLILDKKEPHVLLDVRPEVQFKICSLPTAQSIPLKSLTNSIPKLKELVLDQTGSQTTPIYVICRRGGESVTATKLLHSNGLKAINIDGGVTQWANEVDTSFPTY